MNPHENFLDLALREARLAQDEGEVPVGAVVVRDGQVIGRGHNRTESLQDPTAHAEMLAITAAADQLGSWRLEECTLYVTLEPCTMCGGAMVLARLPLVVFGAWDPKAGACGSVHNVVQNERLNHRVELLGGVREAECGGLLKRFFQERRADARRLREARRGEGPA